MAPARRSDAARSSDLPMPTSSMRSTPAPVLGLAEYEEGEYPTAVLESARLHVPIATTELLTSLPILQD